jgi:hypothetical protein
MNSIISWVGGKKALRELIYQRMPKEFGRYIEVFGGGGLTRMGGTKRETPGFKTAYGELFRNEMDSANATFVQP